MPLKLFTLYTVVAIVPWSILFIYLGEKLGGNWRQIKEYASDYTHYIIIGAVLFIALYFWFKVFQKRRVKVNDNSLAFLFVSVLKKGVVHNV